MTAPVPLFRLVAEVAEIHNRSAGGRVEVVPVLVDDLDKARVAFEALCRVANGRLLLTASAELQKPVAASDDVTRLEAIGAALTTVSSGGSRYVRLIRGATEIDAEYVDPPMGSDPSLGERSILGLARAIAHRDLDSTDLAVVAWADSSVDVQFRRCAWSLMVDHLDSIPSSSLRTLVAVIESPIEIGRHCQHGRGFKLALQDNRIIRRPGREVLATEAGAVARHSDPMVFFLGAGFGASSRLPMGNTVRDQAIRNLLGIDAGDPTTSDELAHRFHRWMVDRPQWMLEEERAIPADEYVAGLTLEQVIRAESMVFGDLPTLRAFKAHHDDVVDSPGSAPLDLARIAELRQGKLVIVEVNFDQLVERHASVPVKVFAAEDEFQHAAEYVEKFLSGRETVMPVLKLHGTIDRFDTCVVTDNQTALGVGPLKLAALRALLDDVNPRLWVFIGASMRDLDLSQVFSDEGWARGVDERWVAPYLEESVERFGSRRRPFWQNTTRQGIASRLVSETADTFLDAVRTAVES